MALGMSYNAYAIMVTQCSHSYYNYCVEKAFEVKLHRELRQNPNMPALTMMCACTHTHTHTVPACLVLMNVSVKCQEFNFMNHTSASLFLNKMLLNKL